MFEAIKIADDVVGYSLEREATLFFFGTKFCTQGTLLKLFPHLEFAFLAQVHGRDVLPADASQKLTADGHFTDRKNLGLVIQTADCLPILMSSKTRILALHAGWRGLVSNIIEAASSSAPDVSFAAIGPHIRAESFEVGIEVAEQLQKIAPNISTDHLDPKKKYVNLESIAHSLLKTQFGAGLELSSAHQDTLTSPLYHSYRRGKEKSERNYSFVARI
jgi:YfiH family protein